MPASPLSHNLKRSFGVLLALLLFLVAFSMFNFRSLSEANSLNIHTHQIITDTLRLDQTIYAIDSGVRGYLVAGESASLNSYRAHIRTFKRQSQQLQAATLDNPQQIANFQQLDGMVESWQRDVIEPLIKQRQQITDPESQISVATNSSAARRRELQKLQTVTKQITKVEEDLLVERTQNQQRVAWWTRFTLLSGGAFSVLLTVFLVSFAAKSTRKVDETNILLRDAKTRAEATNEQLLQINAQLENEIAARRAADEKLRRSVLDLQRSNAELEQFAYVASHDLQEPLRAVGGCVQVLQRRYEGKLDARADQFIQHAVDGAQRMQTLINDLLAYSRVGTKNKAFQVVAGEKIVQAALQNLAVARAESQAQITVDELPELICDAGQIEQVLQNLIANALKFRGEAAPRVHIGYASRQGNGQLFHVLSVEDEGVGIEPQYFERIFVMFQRLHTRNDYAGTGIGLAICKKIVERHGGTIWVESWHHAQNQHNAPDSGAKQGSKFSFSLPVEPEIDSIGDSNGVASGAENAGQGATPLM